MRITVTIGGDAGQGVAKAGEILAKALCEAGYYAFNYRDYRSLIRGGHNFNIITFSENPVHSHDWEADFLLAMDEDSMKRKVKEDGVIIKDSRVPGEADYVIEGEKILKEIGAPPIALNTLMLGFLWKTFGLPFEILSETIKEELGKEVAIRAAEKGYSMGEEKLGLLPREKPGEYINGSEAVAFGALEAGLTHYFAYPMTPSTPVLHILSSVKKEKGILVYQPENEIAVINIALGASYAGARVMVGTSGGGFALMNEALAMAGMAEIPIVIYLAMRYAPATGIPTYTSQGDMMYAVFAGHGEFPKVVIAPGDHREAFERTVEAFYFAYRFNTPVILLSDKHLAESGAVYKPPKPRVKVEDYTIEPGPDYKPYAITIDGVSPRALPGEAVVKANSYEHDEWGITIEDAETARRMVAKRNKKFETIRKEIEKFEPFKIYGEGENLIVSWGSTKGAILDALPELPDWSFLQISYLWPLPNVRPVLEKAKRVVLVENTKTGLLSKLIAMETGFIIEEKVLKDDGRPFTPKEIVEAIK